MSTYYGYNSSFGGKQPLPRYYGSTAPYAATPSTSGPPTTGTGPYGTFGQYPTGPYAPTPSTSQPTAGRIGIDNALPSTPAAKPAPDFSHLDYSNDPILGRIRALAEESISQAQADATAARTRLVIGLGDSELASKLGLGNKVQEQAAGNEFGTFQELARQLNRRNTFDITGKMSDEGNLFYSTARTRALGLSGEQYLRDKSQATSAAQGTLADIAARVTQARMAAQAQIVQAEQDAYMRAIQQAMAAYYQG